MKNAVELAATATEALTSDKQASIIDRLERERLAAAQSVEADSEALAEMGENPT